MKANEAPDRPWKSISMDFITDLPLSEGSDAILIVIDRLTKMGHFIPSTKDMNARQFQETFMREIFRLHGLPRDIITDRGSIFTSDIWKQTTKKLGIERRLSTAFYQQRDGQTERTNSTLEQYLRAYVNYQQDDWKELLPMAEFAYNNGYQESTKQTPFFANYGTNPEYQAIGHLIQGKTTSPEDMSQLHDTLQAEMTEAQIRHKEYYDAQRKPDPNIQQGDRVWLLPRNIRTTRRCKKLNYTIIGPFKILARIGTSAYKLDLQASMRIHNTFHISLLELYNDNKLPSQRSEPPPPIIIEGEPEYELEEIIDSRLHYNKLQYRARWTGYSPEHDITWYPADNFENADLAKRNFHYRYPSKPHLDQTRGTGERRRARLCIADTDPGGSRSTPIEDTNPAGKLGNHDRLARDDADKPAIPLTFGLGSSSTKAKSTRCTPLDGVLQRQLLGARQRKDGTRMVPQEIQCYAIRLEPAIRDEGTSTGGGPNGPNFKKPATKAKALRQKLEGMLERQVPTHVQYKVDAGYYPQKDGMKKELSHWHRYHRDPKFCVGRKGVVGTRQEREGSEKTQPDIEALHRQIRELLDRRERSLKNEDDCRLKIADQQAKIGRLQEDVQGLRRTVAGSGFGLGRFKREVDDARKGNQELESRNHELKKELRRAGRKLVDLGN